MSKPLSILFALGLLAMAAMGQSTNPVRLVLIAPEAALRPALDLLTVELARNEKIVLLERAEIERVWRDQSLAPTSKNYLKLGLALGAGWLEKLNRPRAQMKP